MGHRQGEGVLHRARAQVDRWDRVAPLLQDGTLGPPAPGSSDPASAEEGVSAPASREEVVITEVGVALEPRDFIPPPEPALPESAADGRGSSRRSRDGRVAPVAVVAAPEGLPGRSPLIGLALVAGTGETAQGVWVRGSELGDPMVRTALGRLAGASVVGHEVKKSLRSLLATGVEAASPSPWPDCVTGRAPTLSC